MRHGRRAQRHLRLACNTGGVSGMPKEKDSANMAPLLEAPRRGKATEQSLAW